VVIVDIRDPRDIRARRQIPRIRPAPAHAEFWIEPPQALCQSRFRGDEAFHLSLSPAACAPAACRQTAQDMGLKPVGASGGGFAAWRAAGLDRS